MKKNDIMKQLKAYGDPKTKAILMKHGAQEPFFGVKVQDLKQILKKTKKNHELSLELYDTGNSDAMYLACLMADEMQITKSQLQDWVKKAYWSYLFEYAVPWITAETVHGWELGLKWIESSKENIAAAGWSTLASLAGLKPNEELDHETYQKLLDRIKEELAEAPNRVRYAMNGFVIAVGSYIPDLTSKAQQIGRDIGKVSVEMNGTACKVPFSPDYIQKVVDRGSLGKKRKSARC